MTTLILFICLFLFGVSAVQHYFRNSIIPEVGWVLIAGIVYGIANANLRINLPVVDVEPDIVLFLLLPVLIFDSARSIPLKVLKQVSFHAGFYATIGVVVTMLMLAFPFSLITKIPIWDAIFFGAIMAATDPVAVAAIFKNFTFPERLNVMVEGESLLNDGTAIILFVVLSSFILDHHVLSISAFISKFLISIIGATIFGLAMALLTTFIMRKWHEIHDKFIGAVVPLIAVYMSFAVAEHFLHVSGIITVMVCTMAMTQFHSRLESKCTKYNEIDRYFNDFWNFLGDLANKILFFILGSAIGMHLTKVPWQLAPLFIIILIVSRVVAVYSGGLLFKIMKRPLPGSWLNVLTIAGLKGALSVALILLIPTSYAHRELFLCAAFIMIFFSLIVNSLVMRFYLNRVTLEDV